MAVSRKRGDNRVWLGVQGDPKSWDQQRGGGGTIPKLLNELAGTARAGHRISGPVLGALGSRIEEEGMTPGWFPSKENR
jgi:hypothetical protein